MTTKSFEMIEDDVKYELLKTKGGKAVKLGKGNMFYPAAEFSKLSDSVKSEFTNIMSQLLATEVASMDIN